MDGFIADASATLPWCFEDESTIWSEALLDRLYAGAALVVPAHWIVEVTNAMRMAERRGRFQSVNAEAFLDQIERFSLQSQPPLTSAQAKLALAIARKHQLTVYDAIYLELAIRLGLQLATLDRELISAALKEGVSLC